MKHMHVALSEDLLALEAAQFIIEDIRNVLSRSNRYTLVLSGGNTPKKLYQQLAKPNHSVLIDWSKVHVFFGDERFVPQSDERSNYRMAQEHLLSKVAIPQTQIHAFDTSGSPEEGARAYRALLDRYFSNSGTTFDLVLLGLGEDAHTLSLFPNSEWVLNTPSHAVEHLWLEEQQMHRLTLTPGVVNNARTIVWLVSGEKKRQALYMTLDGAPNAAHYPAQLITAPQAEVHWFVDQAAAAKL